jgi:hypothetical protein
VILTLIGLSVAVAGGWNLRKVKEKLRSRREKPKAVNHFGAAIFPETDDPRWQRGKQDCDTIMEKCNRITMSLGKVKTCPDHGIWVDGVPVLNYRGEDDMRQRKYAWDVRREFQARLGMEAIEGTQLLLESVKEG